MKIDLKEITIRELSENYEDKGNDGVFGFDGKLDIRPPYQREFVYKEKQRDLVIDTVTKNFPLNVMYWFVQDDGKFEIIDGQQRTISICQYVNGVFSFNKKYFDNLKKDEQDKILDYEFTVYQCEGDDSEKLEWFKIINIAGVELKPQELRNAVYSGAWVTDAKLHFSKNGCAAYNLASDYMKGVPIQQDYLETAIKWKSKNNIEDYMGKHQHDQNANELWNYFQGVINWVESTFTVKREKMMNGIEWGPLYDKYKDTLFDTNKIEEETQKLVKDPEVHKNKGIYTYLLTRDEKHLSLRTFSDEEKRLAYETQNGVCTMCKEEFEFSKMEGDHIIPWSKGGKTEQDNCQMLCLACNRSGK